jgi:hypothetical protein
MQRRMGMMMVLTVMLAGGLLSALRVKMLAISYDATISSLFLRHAQGIYFFLT